MAKKAAEDTYSKELKVVRMFEPPKSYVRALRTAEEAEATNKKLIEKIRAVKQAMIDDVNTSLKGREAIDEFELAVKSLVSGTTTKGEKV
jgi:hypothetical protein